MESVQFEQEVLGVVRGVLHDHLRELRKLKLEVQDPQISYSGEGREARNSEVTMYISYLGEIVDVIEFHIYRDGEPTANLDGIETWLRGVFDDVLRRHEARVG